MVIPLNPHFIANFPAWQAWIPFWVSWFWALHILWTKTEHSTRLASCEEQIGSLSWETIHGFSASPFHFRLGHSTPKQKIRSLSIKERMADNGCAKNTTPPTIHQSICPASDLHRCWFPSEPFAHFAHQAQEKLSVAHLDTTGRPWALGRGTRTVEFCYGNTSMNYLMSPDGLFAVISQIGFWRFFAKLQVSC